MNETIRAFIAVELNPEVKESLANLEKELKTSGADVKWVNLKIIHITLKFLGETAPDQINQIKKILDEVAKDFNCFSLEMSGLGAFPNLKSPRVIWVGTEKGKLEISKLAQTIDEELSKIGLPKESKPFSAHITIGRVRSSLNRLNLIEKIQKIKYEPKLNSSVESIILYKSTLTPSGPIYEPLYKANLEKT